VAPQGPQLAQAVKTLATNNTAGLLQQLRTSGAVARRVDGRGC